MISSDVSLGGCCRAHSVHLRGGEEAGHGVRKKLRQKRNAMRHKADDHEEEENMGGMTMGGM